ncbi:MAG: VWA domain-containing protein [Saprospiraceae bacterium]
MEEKIRKWRLILGSKSDAQEEYDLDKEDQGMDDVLDALYDSDRKGDLGTSAPNVNRWLGDIRTYFPSSVVQVMQKDALDRLGLKRLLLEPELLESIEMDVHLVSTILNLQKVMPAKTRKTAKEVVRKVVKELEKKLRNPMRQAIEGSLSRMVRNRRPKHNEIDWHRTIRQNLKHYQSEYKTIIPEQLLGYGKKGKALREVILLIDQSGSMGPSVVYSSIFGAVMASLRSLKTHLIAFDTSVVDLTEELHDPVDLLFAVQLGGGTDINQAVAYAENLIHNPTDTIFILISDLFEGGNEQDLLRRIAKVKSSGAQFISLLALNDKGAPSYDRGVAAKLAAMDVPAFACTPDQFPGLMASAIQKEDIRGWMGREGIGG